MHKICISPLLFLSLSAVAQKASSDTSRSLELEAITIVGSKSKSIPGSGQHINHETIEKLNQPNINHVLRLVPGVNIRDEEGFGLRPNIGLRGTPVNRSAKITLMEDGILMAPAPYADPSAYYFPTFARMQGVEVLKGSSQIKYGPYTIGGAVNLISTSIPSSFNGFAQLSYGSFHTNQQRVWVGDSKKNFDYVFEVNRLASNGFKELDNGGHTGFDRRDLMGKLRWHTPANTKMYQSLTLKFVNTTEESNETYLGLTFDDYKANANRRYAGTQKDKLDMSHQHISLTHSIFPVKSLSINTTAYYATTFRDWARANSFGGQSINNILNHPETHQTAYRIMTGQENGDIDYQSAARTYHSKGIQLNANYHFNTRQLEHHIQAGVRAHADQADRYATRSTYSMTDRLMILTAAGVKGNQENQLRDANSVATYLNYDVQYKGLKISAGFRHETVNLEFRNFGNADNARLGTALKTATNQLAVFLPGVGFNYEINSSMNVFGGVHKGFSPPGMPSVTAVNGQATAEKSINYELGYRMNTKGFHAQVTGFINNYDNILGSDNISGGGAGTGNMFNAGHAIIRGVEMGMQYDLLYQKTGTNRIKLPVCFEYTYTLATFEDSFVNGGGDWGSGTIQTGDHIPFITPHMLTGSIGIESNKWNTTLTGRYTGATRVKPGQGDKTTPSENIPLADVNALKGFLIIDFSSNYRINRTFTAFTTLNNITNSKAIVANLPQGYRPNIPLSFNLGMKANF